jgi:hypothetical protein
MLMIGIGLCVLFFYKTVKLLGFISREPYFRLIVKMKGEAIRRAQDT